jgi:hypothetical protein
MIRRIKGQKYGNVRVEYDGEYFDSKRELSRYLVLLDAFKNGEIFNLERQPTFILVPAIKEQYVKRLKTKDKICERVVQRPIIYKADFRYNKNGETVVEDVKVSPHCLPKEFQLKMKLMRYVHNIEVRCIYKASEPI